MITKKLDRVDEAGVNWDKLYTLELLDYNE